MSYRHLLPAAALTALLHTWPAAAQSDPMQLARVTMANQVGVMEYCMDKGWADQAAVDSLKKSASAMPAGTDSAAVTGAEAAGRQGEMRNGSSTTTLAAMAQRSNTTAQDLCTRMAASAKMVASQQSSMPTMPGMPGMTGTPGGGAMPAMPAMPSGMPAMPAMPKP